MSKEKIDYEQTDRYNNKINIIHLKGRQ